ncbi:MAG: hypothetical protein AAFO69_01330 [Bacteroidota bacterium]
MKRVRIIAAFLIALSVIACNEEETTSTAIDVQVSEADLESEESATSTYEEIDDVVEQSMLDIPSSGRGIHNRDESISCAEISHDEENNTIEVVFDGSCEGPGGHVKSGKIIITYNDARYVPGAFRRVEFEDFYFDDVQVEGVRTITNVAETSEDAPTFNITLAGGRLTFADGTSITRDADYTRTWERAANPFNDQVTLTGGASGVRRDGTEYTSEITSPLVFKRSCRMVGTARIPVSGTKEIAWDGNLLETDFGDGTCDRLASVTLNGETTEVELNPRGHKK